MIKPTRLQIDDFRGAARLAVDATVGVTDLVEKMHHTIQRTPLMFGKSPEGGTRGITGLVYGSIRGVTKVVGRGLEAGIGPVLPWLESGESSPGREAFVSVMNGVHGDYLARTGNPLAIEMSLRQDGRAVEVASPGNAGGRLMVLVHGLCMNDLQWGGERGQPAQDLARELGYVPLYLHYNTGLHVATNGRAFADALESLRAQWPVPIEELVIVGHSMGGLVARSACHYAAREHHEWLDSLHKLVFLGTPHHGAPLERGGNLLDFMMALSPYSAPFTRLGKIRSEGITDLRHGSVLEEDWADRDRFELSRDERRPVPLPKDVDCFAVAATRGKRRGLLADRLVGDGLVPLMSALGHHRRADHTLAFPKSHQWIGYELGHMDLLDHPQVYAQLRRWL